MYSLGLLKLLFPWLQTVCMSEFSARLRQKAVSISKIFRFIFLHVNSELWHRWNPKTIPSLPLRTFILKQWCAFTVSFCLFQNIKWIPQKRSILPHKIPKVPKWKREPIFWSNHSKGHRSNVSELHVTIILPLWLKTLLS